MPSCWALFCRGGLRFEAEGARATLSCGSCCGGFSPSKNLAVRKASVRLKKSFPASFPRWPAWELAQLLRQAAPSAASFGADRIFRSEQH